MRNRSIFDYRLILVLTVALIFSFSQTPLNAGDLFLEDLAGERHGRVYGEPEIVEGIVENALELNVNEDEDYVELIEPLPHIEDELTVEVWFKAYDFEDYDTILYFRDNNDFALRIQDDWDLNFWNYGEFGVGQVPEEEWVHFAGVYEDGSLSGYIDGELEFFLYEVSHAPNDYQPEGLARRVDREDRHFEGIIDEVRIWEEARTEDEIKEMMEKELTGDEDNLVSYWNFDELQEPGEL